MGKLLNKLYYKSQEKCSKCDARAIYDLPANKEIKFCEIHTEGYRAIVRKRNREQTPET